MVRAASGKSQRTKVALTKEEHDERLAKLDAKNDLALATALAEKELELSTPRTPLLPPDVPRRLQGKTLPTKPGFMPLVRSSVREIGVPISTLSGAPSARITDADAPTRPTSPPTLQTSLLSPDGTPPGSITSGGKLKQTRLKIAPNGWRTTRPR
jgi:hypothetical protein